MSAVTLTFQVSGIEKSHHVAHTKWGKAIFQEHFVHTGRLCILVFFLFFFTQYLFYLNGNVSRISLCGRYFLIPLVIAKSWI